MKKNGKMKRDYRNGLIVVLTMALVSVMAFGFGPALGLKGGSTPSASAEQVTYAPVGDTSPALYVAERNAGSVVGVLTNEQQWNRSTGEVEETLVAQGSGVVIEEGGYVLTNCHVVEEGSAYQVLMPSGEKVDATLVGADSSMDLAVLKVEGDAANELVPVTIGSLDELKVGSTVVAIGNPGGEVLANTVTQGIVSAMERTSVNAHNATRRISYIQHDAAINSGNSGGGLFNYKGELIGINTLKYAGSAYSSVSFEGLGFAIPIDSAVSVAQDLIKYGKVIRPGFGVTVSSYEGPDEPMPNYAPSSVVVHSVNEDGPADKAGLKEYDFIYAVDGERVTSLLDLTSILDRHEAGDTVKVTVVRYAQVGAYQQPAYSSIFGYGFGYGYSNNGATDGELMVGGGYEKFDVDLTLEELK